MLLVKGQLSLGERSSFAPAVGVTAADIRVYVEGRNGRLGLSSDDRDGSDDEGRRLRAQARAQASTGSLPQGQRSTLRPTNEESTA